MVNPVFPNTQIIFPSQCSMNSIQRCPQVSASSRSRPPDRGINPLYNQKSCIYLKNPEYIKKRCKMVLIFEQYEEKIQFSQFSFFNFSVYPSCFHVSNLEAVHLPCYPNVAHGYNNLTIPWRNENGRVSQLLHRHV